MAMTTTPLCSTMKGSDSPGDAARMTDWRLVISGASTGARNMAVDEAIFRARAEGLVPPTLRLYCWQPPAVYLGRFQELDERVDVEAIRARGYDIVRRPTGGRAILHADELTYSVVVREEDVAGGGALMSSYREISRGIEAGLALFGVDASLGKEKDEGGAKADSLPTICFAKAARCDLVADGRKVVGSAQTRSRGTILQHGSIPLSMGLDDLLAVLPGRPTEDLETRRQKVAAAAIGVRDLLGQPITVEQLEAAVRMGFESALSVKLTQTELTPGELAWADELETDKYGADTWTYKTPPRRK